MAIKVGDTFRSILHDSKPLWKVVRKEGPASYLCEVVSEEYEINGMTFESDDAGTQQVFLAEQILRANALSDFFSDHAEKSDEFYASLPVDSVAHYSSRRGAYVRCRVVELVAPCELHGQTLPAGEKALLPIALVGDWPDYEIGRRHPDRVEPGYAWRTYVGKGEYMRPSMDTIYEFGHVVGEDPSSLSSLELERDCFDPGTKYFRVEGVSFVVEAADAAAALEGVKGKITSVRDLVIGDVGELSPDQVALMSPDEGPDQSI